MNSYYIQQADQILPIFGLSSIDEAIRAAGGLPVVETQEAVYMNLATGSVGFASDWDDLSEVEEVKYCSSEERWVAA